MPLLAAVLFAGCSSNSDSTDKPPGEHAVLVHLPPGKPGLSLDLIEDPLVEAIETALVGEFDGNEIGPDEAVLFMYGPDGDALYETIRPVLDRINLPSGSYIVVRYGPPGSEETRITLR